MKHVYGTLKGTTRRIRVVVNDNDVNEHGFPLRVITDKKTGRKYRVSPKSCGVPNCRCENWLTPLSK